MHLSRYIERTTKGRKLTQAFYELSYRRKVEVFEYLLQTDQLFDTKYDVEINSSFYNRLVLALLQHSPALTKKDYPVKAERKQRPEARDADLWEFLLAVPVVQITP